MFSTTSSGSLRLRLLPALLLAAGLVLTAHSAVAAPLPTVTITVTTTADDPTAACTGGPCSVRGAVNRANAITPYSIVTINVPAAGTHYAVTAAGGGQLRLLANEIHVQGTGGLPVFDATGCGCRVFDNETNSAIDHVVITGGQVTSTDAAPQAGGGLLDNGTLSLSNSVISRNRITGSCSSSYYYYYANGYYYYSPQQGGSCAGVGGGGLAKATETPITIDGTIIADNVVQVTCTAPPASPPANSGYTYVTPGTCSGGGGGMTNFRGVAGLSNVTVAGNVVCVNPPVSGSGACQGGSGGGLENQRFMTVAQGKITCNVAGYLPASAPDLSGSCVVPPLFTPASSSPREYPLASRGGGIVTDCQDYLSSSRACSFALSSATVLQNVVARQGGGIYARDTTTLTDVQVTGNHAGNPAANLGDGGGLENSGLLTMTRGAVSQNIAGNAGGGLLNNYAATVAGTSFTQNAAGFSGGAIETYSDSYFTNILVSYNCAGDSGTHDLKTCGTGSGKTGQGGGLEEDGDTQLISGSMIDHNVAAGQHGCSKGGGTLLYDTLVADNTKIEANTACDGGGIYYNGYGMTLRGQTLLTLNHATHDGGGIYLDAKSPQLTIDQSFVVVNKAEHQTGGLYNTTIGDFTLVNGATIAGNLIQPGPASGPPASPRCPNTLNPCN